MTDVPSKKIDCSLLPSEETLLVAFKKLNLQKVYLAVALVKKTKKFKSLLSQW